MTIVTTSRYGAVMAQLWRKTLALPGRRRSRLRHKPHLRWGFMAQYTPTGAAEQPDYMEQSEKQTIITVSRYGAFMAQLWRKMACVVPQNGVGR